MTHRRNMQSTAWMLEKLREETAQKVLRTQIRHRVVSDRVVRLVEGDALGWPAAQRNALLDCLYVSAEVIERILARTEEENRPHAPDCDMDEDCSCGVGEEAEYEKTGEISPTPQRLGR